MGHLATVDSLGQSVSQVGTDKTLKHCQCVWISLILLVKWDGTKVPPHTHSHKHTHYYVMPEVRKCGREEQLLLWPKTFYSLFACDFGGLKSALRVFSKYMNTCRGLPCVSWHGREGCGIGGYALLMWNYRRHFISVKLEHVPWQARWFWLITSTLGIPC